MKKMMENIQKTNNSIDRNFIIGVVQTIVDDTFSESQKRRINVYPDRINCACYKCMDSDKDLSKKRGNLYLNNLFYICFNCDYKTTFDKMCYDNNVAIDSETKMKIIRYIEDNISYKDYEDDFLDRGLESLLDFNQVEEYLNRDTNIPKIFDFKPIEENSPIGKELIRRGVGKELWKDIYQAKKRLPFGVNRYENIMCFLNRKGSKLISIQTRNINPKFREFKIYNFESIYKWLLNIDDDYDDVDIEEVGNLPMNTIRIYNKIGYFFNILNVDFNRKITIFEGYLDSLFFPNSIGAIGVNTDMRFIENNDLEIRYFYDNDKAGDKKTLEKIKDNKEAFLWDNLFDYIVSKKPNSNPYELRRVISKVKDLNQLAGYAKNPYRTFGLENFFSKDYYDIINIPSYRKSSK